MGNAEDKLHFLRPDYLRLLLTYQEIEDYLFQAVYGYLRFGHQKKKEELQTLKNQSIGELTDLFFTSYQVRDLPLKAKQHLGALLTKTIRKRNYYTHQFFSDLYFSAYDEETGDFDEAKFDDIDYALMDEQGRADVVYDYLLSHFGKHQILALRKFDISDRSASLSSAKLDAQFTTPAYASQRSDAFVKNYWNLSYGYFEIEAGLFSIADCLNTKFHFLAQAIKPLESMSLNEYRKLLLLAVKHDALIHMMVNDSLSDLTRFAQDLTRLQEDRNYWLHFCLLGHIGEDKKFDFDAFTADVATFDKLSKSVAFLEKTKKTVFALEEAVRLKCK